MTKKAQEAYAKGFCKVAEAYGVNPEQLYKYAKKKEESNKGKIIGGVGGGLAGLAFGDLTNMGFKGTEIMSRKGNPYNTITYRLGSKIRKALAGDSSRRLLKLLRSGKGKAISTAILAAPTLAGIAGGTGLGGAVDKLLNKD